MTIAPSTGQKSCRICRTTFAPRNSLQFVCGLTCARKVPILAKKQEREEKRRVRARLDALRPRSYWLKQAQAAFNGWVRLRDSHLPCISCGRFHVGSHDAGHYLSTGARPELRFDEANCHRQCVPCNQHLHGNLVLYRVGLIARIGLAEVERLEGPSSPKHYSVDDLKAIRDDYRARAKVLHVKQKQGNA